MFCGVLVWFCFGFFSRDTSRLPKRHLRADEAMGAFAQFQTPRNALRVQARVHLSYRDSAARVPSSLPTILWIQRLLKVVFNLLKVRLSNECTENKAACVPLGKAAKPAGKHHGFWETISIHSGSTPRAWEPKKHIQLAMNWG